MSATGSLAERQLCGSAARIADLGGGFPTRRGAAALIVRFFPIVLPGLRGRLTREARQSPRPPVRPLGEFGNR